jgi:hypothetical protein
MLQPIWCLLCDELYFSVELTIHTNNCYKILNYMLIHALSSHDSLLAGVSVRVRAALRLAVYRQSVNLRAKPLETHDQRFFQLNPCGHCLNVTFYLTSGSVCLLWIGLAIVKCTYRTYSMLLKLLPCALYASPLSVQALQSRSHLFSQSKSYFTTGFEVKVRLTLWLAVYRQSVHLGVKPLHTHGQRFFQLNPCGHSTYITSSLTRRWVCLLWICLVFREV